MKSIKKIVAACFMLVLAINIAQAQGPGRGGKAPKPEEETKKMTADLGLDEIQTQQVAQINADFAEKRKELRAQRDGDRTVMREAMQKARKEKADALKNVLTAEQFDTWTQMNPRGKNGKKRKKRKEKKADVKEEKTINN